jgi:hypothetical protein
MQKIFPEAKIIRFITLRTEEVGEEVVYSGIVSHIVFVIIHEEKNIDSSGKEKKRLEGTKTICGGVFSKEAFILRYKIEKLS